jgi:hypothetical protein
MDEYFLITHQESGDETHFMLLSMSDYQYVDDARTKFSDTSIPWEEVFNMMGKIYDMVVEDFFIQTYCLEDWPFGKYNIKKIMSIPEFGC